MSVHGCSGAASAAACKAVCEKGPPDPKARPAPVAAPSVPAPAPVATAPAHVDESAPWDLYQYGSREDMEMYDIDFPPGYVHTKMRRT